MTIATASPNSVPWISPVFFAYDQNYNLYWISDKDSRHSQLIATNPNVAIVIFDSTVPEGNGDGVYFECQAKEITNDRQLQKAIEIYNARATQKEFRAGNINSVTGKAAWRIYQANPRKITKLGPGKIVNSQYVDERIELDSLNNR